MNPRGRSFVILRKILHTLALLVVFGGAWMQKIHAATDTNVNVVDVLVVYTSPAREAAGGTHAINAKLKQAFLEANSVFQNSRAKVRVRLVGQKEVNYLESGSVTTDLERLRVKGDGWLDEVHTWRDTFGADLVCLVTETGDDWDFYGLQGPSGNNAFSILRRPFLTGYNDLPVALGFNFGCQLDRQYADTLAAYPFSFGYTFDINETNYGTVEAFYSSVRLPWFSNPEIIFQGVSCGVPAGQAYAADNTRTLNLTAPLVTAFRGGGTTTRSPVVALTSPTADAILRTGSNLFLTAAVSDSDGFVAHADFFSDGQWIGSVSSLPFTFAWTNPPTGPHRMTAIAVDNYGATSVSEPLDISLLPGNDDFTNRFVITGESADIAADTWQATTEPDEPPPSGSGRTLWWSYTTPATGMVNLSLQDEDNAMVLDVFAGDFLTNLTSLVTALGFDETRVPVAAGQTIQIVADDMFDDFWDSHPFTLHFRFASKPPNDDFNNASILSGTNLSVSADPAGASNEPDEPFDTRHSVWWKWTAPHDGQVVVAAINTNAPYIPSVGVFTGNALADLVNQGSSFNGNAVFNATVGTTYYIAVDGSGDPFTLTLQIPEPPANDNFADAMTLPESPTSVPVTTLGATIEPGEPEHFSGTPLSASVWFRWVAPREGAVKIEGVARVVGVYTGTSLSNLVRVAEGQYQTISFPATSGTTYFISIAEINEPRFDAPINLIFTFQSPNDNFANRFLLSGEMLFVRGSNYLTTLEPGEPTSANFGNSVWWSWTAPRDGVVTIQGYSVGAFTVPIMAVYTGNVLSNLSLVASNGLANSLRPFLSFPASQGTSYQIALAGNGGLQGELGFTLDMANFRITNPLENAHILAPSNLVIEAATGGIQAPFDRVQFKARSLLYGWTSDLGAATNTPYSITWSNALYLGSYELTAYAYRSNDLVLTSPPSTVYLTPVNDSFTNAILLQGDGTSASGSPSGATAEPGEPKYVSSENPRTIWWRWIAPTNGILEAYFDNNSYQASAEVYQGIDIAHLTNVSHVGHANSTRFPFFVTGASTNYVAMKGSSSTFHLLFAPLPPADNFAEAQLITSTRYNVTFGNLVATHEPGEPFHGGLTNGAHSVWWKWVAPVSGRAFPLANGTWPPTKPGIGLGVYTGTTLTNLTPVTLVLTNGPDDSSSSQPAFDAIAGQLYFIAMDSDNSVFWKQTFQFSFVPTMIQDTFSNRMELSGTSLSITGSTFLATSEPDETNRAGFGAGKSLWWRWTAPADGVLRLSSSRSLTRPLIGIYTGDVLSNLTPVAITHPLHSSIHVVGIPVIGPLETNLAIEVEQGTTYLLVVDAPIGLSGGEFIIDLDFTSLRLISPSINFSALAPTNLSVTGTFDEAIDGPLSHLNFYAGTNLLGSGFAPDYSFIWSNAPPGQHLLRASATNALGKLLESFPHKVAIGISTNDFFASRILLVGTNAQLSGNNIGATHEPDEPALSGGALGQTLWWSWTAPANGAAVLSTPANASFRPAIGIFTVTTLTNLNLIANNSYQECVDFGANCWWRQRDQLTLNVTGGTTYFIAVDGYTHGFCDGSSFPAAGQFEIAFNFFSPPANDLFAARTLLNGSSIILSNVNWGATREQGEPAHSGNTNARSVWYQWTPPFSGKARITGEIRSIIPPSASDVIIVGPGTIDPCNPVTENPAEEFPRPVWSVFSGTTLANLLPVTSGTNVECDVIAGQPIIFAATGPGDSSGAFVLRLELSVRPVNDDFVNRLVLPSSTYIDANNKGATREIGEPEHSSANHQSRTLWWTWTAPSNGTVRMRAWADFLYSDEDLCARAYLGNALTSLVPVSEKNYSGETAFYAEAGATYQIAITSVSSGNEYEGEFTLYLAAPPASPTIESEDSHRELDGSFRLGIIGETGQSFVLQASSDLVNWENLVTDTVNGGLAEFIDSDAKNYPQRFYRTAPLDSLMARQPLGIRSFSPIFDSRFHLMLQGNPGDGYLLQASTNLSDWNDVSSGIIYGNSVEWSDPDSDLFPTRFYRLLPFP